jgi:hypothetical protein
MFSKIDQIFQIFYLDGIGVDWIAQGYEMWWEKTYLAPKIVYAHSHRPPSHRPLSIPQQTLLYATTAQDKKDVVNNINKRTVRKKR